VAFTARLLPDLGDFPVGVFQVHGRWASMLFAHNMTQEATWALRQLGQNLAS
jgi:hypothetical protein